MIEAAREEEQISINRACRILGLSRTEYYRKVYGLRDYQKKERVIKEVAPEKKEAIERLSQTKSMDTKRYGLCLISGTTLR